MNQNELRIGNYIQAERWHTNKLSIKKVVGINEKGIYVAYGRGSIIEKSYKPIPLTEEILLKCGLIKGYSGYGYDVPKRMYSLTAFIGIAPNGDSQSAEWYNISFINQGCIQVISSVKYLHQLQNFYLSITKYELEYNG